jgi:hypothetical protein
MKLLFTRPSYTTESGGPSYTTKRGVCLTPTYYLFHGSLVKRIESSREDSEIKNQTLSPSVAARFSLSEKIAYLEAFDFFDVENCDKLLCEFVYTFSRCRHLWETKLSWPAGREKLADLLPYLANSMHKKCWGAEFTMWTAHMWAAGCLNNGKGADWGHPYSMLCALDDAAKKHKNRASFLRRSVIDFLTGILK